MITLPPTGSASDAARPRDAQSTETQAYSIIFLVLFFILILNFVLAIIVDAYMNVRRVVLIPRHRLARGATKRTQKKSYKISPHHRARRHQNPPPPPPRSISVAWPSCVYGRFQALLGIIPR